MEHVRINETTRLLERGDLRRTPYCDGPITSMDLGRDSPCCALCHIIRCAYYRGDGQVIGNQHCIEFVRKVPIAKTVCLVSTCNEDIPIVFFYNGNTDLQMESYANALKSQFIARKEMRLIDRDITRRSIAFDSRQTPVVLPSNSTERFDGRESDNGVLLDDTRTLLTVIDKDKAYAAGRWMHVINYYQALTALNPRVALLPGQKKIGERVWMNLL